MRISDWSSDVCSSDLVDGAILPDQLVAVFDRGEQMKIPVLAGFNSGEVRSQRRLVPPVSVDAAAYEAGIRSEEHTSALKSLMCISYVVFSMKKKNTENKHAAPHNINLRKQYTINNKTQNVR